MGRYVKQHEPEDIHGKYFAMNTDNIFHSLDNETAQRTGNEIQLHKSKLQAKLLNFGLWMRVMEKKICDGVIQ